MAKLPADRFQTYDEFIMALTPARSQLLVSQLRHQSRTDDGSARGGGARSWWRRS
jgi:hypothetical protein